MRVQMRSEISRLHSELGSTMIYVTHDQVEAMTMGDRICVMRDGKIMQTADPLTLYRQPVNMFVAGFIGSPPMNLIRGVVQRREGGFFFVQSGEVGALELPLSDNLEPLASKHLNKELVLGIRPEHISNEDVDDSSAAASLTVQTSEPMGSESLVYFKAGQGSLIARIQGEHIFHLGENVTVLNRPRKSDLLRSRNREYHQLSAGSQTTRFKEGERSSRPCMQNRVIARDD